MSLLQQILESTQSRYDNAKEKLNAFIVENGDIGDVSYTPAQAYERGYLESKVIELEFVLLDMKGLRRIYDK